MGLDAWLGRTMRRLRPDGDVEGAGGRWAQAAELVSTALVGIERGWPSWPVLRSCASRGPRAVVQALLASNAHEAVTQAGAIAHQWTQSLFLMQELTAPS
jgi:hypothetical protein